MLRISLRPLLRPTPRRRRLGLLVIMLLGAIAAWRFIAWIETPRFHPVSIDPTAEGLLPRSALAISRDARVLGVVYPRDGGDLYVALEIGALDLWAILVDHWLEVALGVLVVGAVLLAFRLLRRRPTEADAHCRKCNYALVHCPSAKCPECGLDLTPHNRLSVRRSRARLLFPLAIVLGAAGAYVPLRDRVPRFIAARHWFTCPSTFLFDRAWHHGYQPLCHNHKVYTYRVLAVDPESGRVRRTILRGAGREMQPWTAITATADGSAMAVAHAAWITVFDTATGRTRFRCRVDPPTGPRGSRNFFHRAAFSADGRSLYAGDWQWSIYRWSAGDGTLLDRGSVEALVEPATGSTMLRHLCPTGDGAVLLVTDNPGEDATSFLTAVEAGLRPPALGDQTVPEKFTAATVHPDGARWYGLEMQGDLHMGGTRGDGPERRLRIAGDLSTALAVSPDGRLLAVGRFESANTGPTKGAAALHRTDDLEPITFLARPELFPLCFAFTPDGAALAVGGSLRGPSGLIAAVVVFDVSEVR